MSGRPGRARRMWGRAARCPAREDGMSSRAGWRRGRIARFPDVVRWRFGAAQRGCARRESACASITSILLVSTGFRGLMTGAPSLADEMTLPGPGDFV